MSSILILKGDRPKEHSTAYATWSHLVAYQKDEYYLESLADVVFIIRNGSIQCLSMKSGRDLASYNLVYIRDLDYEPVRNALTIYLQSKHTSFINEDSAHFSYTSKLAQMLRFALAGLSVPDTLYVHPIYRKRAAKQFGFIMPVVVKAIAGSNGRDNELITEPSRLDADDLPPESLIQKYIENTFDYRIIVADTEVLLAYKRVRRPGSDYKNNVAQGAVRKLVNELPPEVSEMAIRAAALTNRQLSGVDILPVGETGKYCLLEVNYNFGMADLNDGIAPIYYQRLEKYLRDKADMQQHELAH